MIIINGGFPTLKDLYKKISVADGGYYTLNLLCINFFFFIWTGDDMSDIWRVTGIILLSLEDKLSNDF